MTKKRKASKKTVGNRLPPFVPMTWELLNSKAYKALTPSAAKSLPYFIGKVKVPFNDPDKYTSQFCFTYSEAEAHGTANATHNAVIRDLIAKGFIDPISKGGLRWCGLTSSRFKLSTRWEEYGTSLFKEVEDWNRTPPDFPRFKKTKAASIMENYNSSYRSFEGESEPTHFHN